MYELKPFDSLHLGQTVSVRKTITEADGALYIAATGDFGPVHVDDSYAQTTRFGQRLAPGILVAGICTSVLTAELAGTLGISIEDRFWFTGPVFYGDTIEFKVWIAQMNAEVETEFQPPRRLHGFAAGARYDHIGRKGRQAGRNGLDIARQGRDVAGQLHPLH